MKKLTLTLKVHISVMAWQIQLKFETGPEVPHPEGVSTAKMVNFWSGTIKLQMCENKIFLVSVKYILVCRVHALDVHGCTTQYRVS